MVSDAELARRIAGGDAVAESELCQRFAPRIRLYGLKHLRDADRARDLVQSVLVAVLEAARAGRIEDPEHVDRFVLGTCRNLAHRQRAADARAEPTEEAKLDIASVLPELGGLDVEALLRCMVHVEPRARTILYLAFCRDQSADEIARLLSMTAGNVRVVRHRAVAQLRTCLGMQEVG